MEKNMKNRNIIFLSSILLTSLQINAMEKVTEAKEENVNNTDLIYAAEYDDIEKVELLLNSGIDPDVQNGLGETALITAAVYNHIEIVEKLLKAEANKNAQNKCKSTALIVAVLNNHIEIVELLLNSDVNKDIQNKWGDTALTLAAWEGYAKIVEKLLKAGADTTIKDKCNKTFYDYISDKPHIQEIVINYQNQIADEIYNSDVLPKELANVVAKILIERDVEKVEESKEDN